MKTNKKAAPTVIGTASNTALDALNHNTFSKIKAALVRVAVVLVAMFRWLA